MNERPKIKLELTKTDQVFEIIGWVSILAIWGLTITNYQNLPDIIPTHYNAAGKADNFGNKATIWTLPIIATLLFVGLTKLNKYPHIFNYPVTITKENALNQYTNITRMFRCMKLILVIVFGLVIYNTIQHANGNADGLGIWLLPLILGLVFVPLSYFVIKSFKTK